MAKAPKTKPKAAKPAPAGIGSVRALAPLLGKSHTAVNEWVKDSRWPFGPGPWKQSDTPAMKTWAARTLSPDPSAAAAAVPRSIGVQDLDPGRQLDLAIKLEKVETSKFNRELKAGKFHSVDECVQHRARQVQEVKNAFLTMADGLPVPQELRDIVRGRVMEICLRFANAGRTA